MLVRTYVSFPDTSGFLIPLPVMWLPGAMEQPFRWQPKQCGLFPSLLRSPPLGSCWGLRLAALWCFSFKILIKSSLDLKKNIKREKTRMALQCTHSFPYRKIQRPLERGTWLPPKGLSSTLWSLVLWSMHYAVPCQLAGCTQEAPWPGTYDSSLYAGTKVPLRDNLRPFPPLPAVLLKRQTGLHTPPSFFLCLSLSLF